MNGAVRVSAAPNSTAGDERHEADAFDADGTTHLVNENVNFGTSPADAHEPWTAIPLPPFVDGAISPVVAAFHCPGS